MKLIIKSLNIKQFDVLIYSSQTVAFLKQKIFKKLRISEDQQQLVCAGKTLEDHRKLKECDVHSGCTIHLTHLHPLGGRCFCGGKGCSN